MPSLGVVQPQRKWNGIIGRNGNRCPVKSIGRLIFPRQPEVVHCVQDSVSNGVCRRQDCPGSLVSFLADVALLAKSILLRKHFSTTADSEQFDCIPLSLTRGTRICPLP